MASQSNGTFFWTIGSFGIMDRQTNGMVPSQTGRKLHNKSPSLNTTCLLMSHPPDMNIVS